MDSPTDTNEIVDNDEKEYFEHFSFTADPGQRPERIDRYLAHKIQNVSRSKIQDAASANCILVNNKAVKPSYNIKPGDRISVLMSFPPRSTKLVPENIPLNIIYEDNSLLVIDKEAGMVVHPAFGNYSGTLVNALAYYLKNLPLFSSGDSRPGLVHRIDKDTSGLIVIAKDEVAKMKLAKQFFEKTTERKYKALVWGNFSDDSGTITGNIGRHLKNRKIMDVFPVGEHGKPAVTHYKVIERFGYVTLLECRLETGRTHQIRAHLKYAGHPLFNDHDYGGDRILKGTTFSKYRQFVENCFAVMKRQALHACMLGFEHPLTNERMFFESDLPEDFATVLEKWRKYSKKESGFC
jgi:23S rRNA pseudouridine1911/1915/1917 synthase